MDEIYNEDGSINRDKWLNFVIRPLRNTLLNKADERVRRYDYQVRTGVATTESAETITALLAYMQVLRDIPATAQPDSFEWPSIP